MAEQQSGKLFTFFSFFKMKSNIRSRRKNLSFMNFSRGNISNTRKALTEKKWNLKRINHGFGERGAWFQLTHFFKYKLRLSGAKVILWTRLLIVCLFIWCCLQNRICYVCTVSSMELFIVLKMADYQLLNMPSQDTLHRFEMKLW